MRAPVTDRAPFTEEEIAVVRGWIASVRRGEPLTGDLEVERLAAEVLERWLDGEIYEEILRNWRRPKQITRREGGSLRDPPQEFAERVAAEWFGLHGLSRNGPSVDRMATFIADELRAGGWLPGATSYSAASEPVMYTRREGGSLR